MDFRPFLVTNPEAPLLEQPSEDALDNGAMLAQAASMDCVPSCDLENDLPLPEWFAVLVLGIAGLVSV